MAKYLDISSWNRQIHVHTTGTREKYILISPDDEKFYFKTSVNRGKKDYKYEFWSEIITSELGNFLGFNVLHYSVASLDNLIGCISKSIINEDEEEHHEGYRFIIQKYPDFATNYKKTHSFQKIIGSLENIELGHLKKQVIEMLVFDAIIGNTDRHSENWALIVNKREEYKKIEDLLTLINSAKWYLKIYVSIIIFIETKMTLKTLRKKFKKLTSKFSPIYDNGSSLARELSEDKIKELMNDDEKFESFLLKCHPDIRWENSLKIKQLNHFDLIRTVQLDYSEIVIKIINRIKSKYSKQKLKEIVYNIDDNVPDTFADHKIPNYRKDFIIKYIDLRINKILNIYEQVF